MNTPIQVTPKNNTLIHIYSPEIPHDDVYIVANRRGLSVLRDLIDKALQARDDMSVAQAMAFNYDGEGYDIYAVRMEDTGNQDNNPWKSLQMPYTDEDFLTELGQHPGVLVDSIVLSSEDPPKGEGE